MPSNPSLPSLDSAVLTEIQSKKAVSLHALVIKLKDKLSPPPDRTEVKEAADRLVTSLHVNKLVEGDNHITYTTH